MKSTCIANSKNDVAEAASCLPSNSVSDRFNFQEAIKEIDTQSD